MNEDGLELEVGDPIFTSDEYITSKAIRWFNGGDKSHVVVYVGKGLILESSWSGVVLTSLKSYTENPKVRCTAVKLPSHIDRQEFIDKLYEHIGEAYDFKLFFGHILQRMFGQFESIISRYDVPSQWLCYEIIGNALESCGELFPEPVIELNPDKLFDYLYDGKNAWQLSPKKKQNIDNMNKETI